MRDKVQGKFTRQCAGTVAGHHNLGLPVLEAHGADEGAVLDASDQAHEVALRRQLGIHKLGIHQVILQSETLLKL